MAGGEGESDLETDAGGKRRRKGEEATKILDFVSGRSDDVRSHK